MKKWRQELEVQGPSRTKYQGLVYHRSMPKKLKSKVYKTVLTPVLLYGTEASAAKAEYLRKSVATEMKCLGRVVAQTNEGIRAEVPIADSQRERNAVVWLLAHERERRQWDGFGKERKKGGEHMDAQTRGGWTRSGKTCGRRAWLSRKADELR